MLLGERSQQLDELLRLTVAQLDIPPVVRAAAVNEYEAVAAWLRDSWPGAAGEIYPQGSIRLGTIVTPITKGCDYDLDLVCRLWVTKDISKRELKRLVGEALRAHIRTRPEGSIRLKEGKRCWTLTYPGQRFHMDVLPAIPNADEESEHAIWLTDRELVRWQPSNPIGYADWFAGRTAIETRMLLEKAAAQRGIDIEDVPAETVKTPLQQSVQALKRHRDIHFEDTPQNAPASIILTTLAAQAYEGGGGIFEVLVEVTQRMPELVEQRDGAYVVANPVLEDENFADRWRGHSARASAFFDWIEAAHGDFAGLGQQSGVDRLLEALAMNLGREPAERAGRNYTANIRQLQRAGRIRTTSSGLLAAAPAASAVIRPRPLIPSNPPHTFHGRTVEPQR
jgi:hypothetical protein